MRVVRGCDVLLLSVCRLEGFVDLGWFLGEGDSCPVAGVAALSAVGDASSL